MELVYRDITCIENGETYIISIPSHTHTFLTLGDTQYTEFLNLVLTEAWEPNSYVNTVRNILEIQRKPIFHEVPACRGRKLETTHNKDCAVTVDKQPTPKPSKDGFA